MTLEPKAKLAHYEIQSPIGAGGMGEVYLALDTSAHNRKVAIKVLAAGIVPDPERMRRFEMEARTVTSLNHPNILTIYESGLEGSTRFIAMEYVDGLTLREHMSQAALAGRLNAPAGARRVRLLDVLGIATQIAAALDAAHDAKVVHRDIKPENIMIRRRDSIVKVIDFGLAKLVDRPKVTHTNTTAPMLTRPGSVMGTVTYMSPEQTEGASVVDNRSDIWSMGVVLYEMITGRLPFEGRDEHRIIVAIQENDPAPLATYATGLPERLEEIVNRTLAKNPDERYQSAKDLLIDLRNLSRKLEVAAVVDRTQRPESSPPADGRRDRSAPIPFAEPEKGVARSERPAAGRVVAALRRHRLAAGIAVAAVLAAAVGDILLTRHTGPVAPFQYTYLTRSGKATSACVSPEGDSVAYVSSEAGKESLILLNRESGDERKLIPPTAQHYWGLTFSRDAAYVYYVTREPGKGVGGLYRVPVRGGPQEFMVRDVDSPVTFSPDGRQIAFVRNNPPQTSDLWKRDADAKEEEQGSKLATSGGDEIFSGVPAWSPDGRLIACPIRDLKTGHETVFGFREGDGSRIKLTDEHWDDVERAVWLSDDTLIVTAGEQYSGRRIWYLSYPGRHAEPITSGRVDYSSLTLTKDAGTLVAVQFRNQSNVYWGAAASSEPEQLTHGKGVDGYHVSWTPDGRILYDSMVSGGADIWAVKPAGGQPQPLLTGPYADLFPSASSGHLLFISNRSGTYHVWRMDADAGNPTQISTGDIYETTPVGTPDGKWVICQLKGNAAGLWRIPLTVGNPELIVNARAFVPAVDPQGKRVAYWFFTGEEGTDDRHVAMGIRTLPDGSPATPAVIEVPRTADYEVNLQWSADGEAVLYVDRAGGVSNIWSQRLGGGKPEQKTYFTTGNILSFAYSPDGTQLALTRIDIVGEVVVSTSLKR
jgi:serine/threonine protein kinase